MSDEPQLDAPAAEKDYLRTPSEIFRFSQYLHLGAGSEECDERENGRCTNSEHFHCWIRLPNQFQHADLIRRATAAQARAIRALRDPETDAYVVLDTEMDTLAREGDRDEMVKALVSVEHFATLYRMMREAEAMEEFETRREDIERIQELADRVNAETITPEEQDELDELNRHAERFREVVQSKLEDVEAPRRAALEGLSTTDLVAQLREQRIKDEGAAAFAQAYSRYQWHALTLKPCFQGHPQERIFKDVSDLDNAAPEIVALIRDGFTELEGSLQRGVAGN